MLQCDQCQSEHGFCLVNRVSKEIEVKSVSVGCCSLNRVRLDVGRRFTVLLISRAHWLMSLWLNTSKNCQRVSMALQAEKKPSELGGDAIIINLQRY